MAEGEKIFYPYIGSDEKSRLFANTSLQLGKVGFLQRAGGRRNGGEEGLYAAERKARRCETDLRECCAPLDASAAVVLAFLVLPPERGEWDVHDVGPHLVPSAHLTTRRVELARVRVARVVQVDAGGERGGRKVSKEEGARRTGRNEKMGREVRM